MKFISIRLNFSNNRKHATILSLFYKYTNKHIEKCILEQIGLKFGRTFPLR